MQSQSSFRQVLTWGLSFLTVGFAIAFTAFCFGGIAYGVTQINKELKLYELIFLSAILTLLSIFVLIIGSIGMMRKLMVDGITLGMSNATQTSNLKDFPPLNFKQTLKSGLDLISVISTILLIPIILYFAGISLDSQLLEEVCTSDTWNSMYETCSMESSNLGLAIKLGLHISAIVILVSGVFGVFVKIVGDSISHASIITGFGIDKTDKMVHKKANIQTHTRPLSQINQNNNPPMVVAPEMNAQVVQSVEVPDFSAQQIEKSRGL